MSGKLAVIVTVQLRYCYCRISECFQSGFSMSGKLTVEVTVTEDFQNIIEIEMTLYEIWEVSVEDLL